jgi:hypothetical protein
MARAGHVSSWRWRLGPARFGSYRKHISASVSTARGAFHASASETVTTVTNLLFGYPFIFWTPCDRCSIAKSSAAHDRLVQKIALTAIFDQADNST